MAKYDGDVETIHKTRLTYVTSSTRNMLSIRMELVASP